MKINALDALLSRIIDGSTDNSKLAELNAFFTANYDNKDLITTVNRYRTVIRQFRDTYKKEEVFLARAPGRVNLIGEHTDYNGLPVLPMAVNRDFLAAFYPREDDKIIINNTDTSFSERRFQIHEHIQPFPAGDWGNYCKAAVQGLIHYFKENGKDKFKGLDIMINGNIPPSAGLSSSSALVVLCSLSFLSANELEIPGLELAGLMAEAEKYVGTQGGGMDQAASLMGKAGHALKIDFNPLKVMPVSLPQGYRFIVANSMVQAAKSGSALYQYNRRAIECRLAAAVLKKIFSAKYSRDVRISLLGDLSPERLGIPLEEINDLADSVFHCEPYKMAEIASILEIEPEHAAQLYCRKRDGSLFTEPDDGFKLQARYRHIISEGRRVQESAEAFRQKDMKHFGELMNASHSSCRDLYEISCPELDRLVNIATESGALGSRLTGAGFGGCSISLVSETNSESFISRVTMKYYRDFLKLKDKDCSSYIFSCKAVDGASGLIL